LLAQQQAIEAQERLIESMKDKPGELLDTEFHPQSVPAFAATEIFGYLREKFPDFFYKEATLNPTNPRNRSTDWETDVVNQFRATPESAAEFISTRETPGGTSLFLARPIKISNVSCLQCHSTPDKAPPEMIKLYGTANGFGWKMDEVIGAQIVSVPMSVPLKMADATFQSLLKWLAGAFVGIGLVGNFAAMVVARRPPQ
jgi:protein-histidine pros-kinase